MYQGRLSADEQREFDKYYTKWVNDTRKNDRDDIAKDVGHMQEIMARKNIPANVPFDQIASTGYSEKQRCRRLSAEVSGETGSRQMTSATSIEYYARWVDDTRANDQDDLNRDAGYLQAIMARNNIPADVPFEQIASPAAYPDDNYPRDQAWQGRLSADDQREFDKILRRLAGGHAQE